MECRKLDSFCLTQTDINRYKKTQHPKLPIILKATPTQIYFYHLKQTQEPKSIFDAGNRLSYLEMFNELNQLKAVWGALALSSLRARILFMVTDATELNEI